MPQTEIPFAMDTAYANIGLDANTIWRDAPGDVFQKSSDKLWVKLNYLKEKKHHQVGEKGKVVTVHDVIPQSKLAVYGNYSYDNAREMMYNREKPLLFSEEILKTGGEATEEPWMMAEVEQEFRRLTRNCSQPYDLYNGFKPIDCVEVEESIQKKYPVLAKKCQPHTVGGESYLPLVSSFRKIQISVWGFSSSAFKFRWQEGEKAHKRDTEETLEAIYLPNPFYRIDDLNQLELQMRITSTKHIWEHPLRSLMSLINSDKYGEQLRCPTFPEVDYSSERNNLPCVNQAQVFPLPLPFPLPSATSQSPPSQSPFLSSFRLIESLGDLSVRRSFPRTSSTTSQLAEGKTELLPVVKKRSSGEQQHDFTNLTLLTRPTNRHDFRAPDHSAFQVPETVLKWLQTGYPTRSKEFSAIQNLSDELRNVRTSLQVPSISNFTKEKLPDDIFGGKKCELGGGRNLSSNFDNLVCRNENLSASLSSSSSSEQSRPKLSSSGTKLQISPISTLSYSAVSSSSFTGSWQTQTSSLWSSKPFNFLGLAPSDLGFSRDGAARRPTGKPTKCRPILNSQYKEVADEELGFEEGGDKKRLIRGTTDMRTFHFYGENNFDDLERQAIEQWPSEDRMNAFCSKHLQEYEFDKWIVNNRTNTIAKRKSAVQILQETKAFYVKSETVLDKKQEFRPGKVSVSVSESPYRNFSQCESQKENKLEDKLRVLLDFDSFEGSDSRKESGKERKVRDGGAFDKSICFQHKSLPDLSMPPGGFSSESSDSSFNMKYDGDSRSAYSSRTQPETRGCFTEKCVDCRHSTRSSKNFCCPEFRNHSRIYCSFRATKSGEFIESKVIESESSHRRRSSNTSSCNRSRHNSSSKHSQSADSGRQSQGGSVGLRTGRSGLPEFSSPPPSSSWTDSGTEYDSPPLFRIDPYEGDKKRPILRSKSDISYKYCATKPKLSSTPVAYQTHPSPPTTEKLETFFDHLGMDPMDFKELASSSRNSSPVFFSSVSSIDSCVDLTGWTLPEPYKVAECPSIVERNARIIKWLYNCRKFQKTIVNEAKSHAIAKNQN